MILYSTNLLWVELQVMEMDAPELVNLGKRFFTINQRKLYVGIMKFKDIHTGQLLLRLDIYKFEKQ